MALIVGVRIRNSGKLFYFSPENVWPKRGDKVIVETVRGLVMGDVIIGLRKIEDDMLTIPLKPVIRIANEEDIAHQAQLDAFAISAFRQCKEKIIEHHLDMKLVRVEPMFDNSKIMFYFTANQRIDFRDLVKDLATIFKTRIELRQIGVRDEAKIIGTLGVCGRKICCATWLGDFQPVSIKMAKEQSLSLNPTKISGACGRLMCCLKFEEDFYEQMHKLMPKVGKLIDTPEGKGTVMEVSVIKETVTVKLEQGEDAVVKTFELGQVGEKYDPVAFNAFQNNYFAETTKKEKNSNSKEPKNEKTKKHDKQERREKPSKRAHNVLNDKQEKTAKENLKALAKPKQEKRKSIQQVANESVSPHAIHAQKETPLHATTLPMEETEKKTFIKSRRIDTKRRMAKPPKPINASVPHRQFPPEQKQRIESNWKKAVEKAISQTEQ